MSRIPELHAVSTVDARKDFIPLDVSLEQREEHSNSPKLANSSGGMYNKRKPSGKRSSGSHTAGTIEKCYRAGARGIWSMLCI